MLRHHLDCVNLEKKRQLLELSQSDHQAEKRLKYLIPLFLFNTIITEHDPSSVQDVCHV